MGLQSCIGQAQPGDVVQVATNSPINEDLTIDKSLTLRAASGFTPLLGTFRFILLSNPAPRANVITVQDFTLQQGRLSAVQTSLSTFNVTMRDLDVLNTFNGLPEIQVRTGQPGPYGPIVFDVSNNDLTIPANSQFSGADAISIQGSNAQSVTGTIRNNRINHFDGDQLGAIGLANWLANPFDIDVIANEIRGANYNHGIQLFQFGNGNSIVRVLDNLVVGQVNEAGFPGAYVVDITEGSATFEITNNTAADCGNGILIDGADEVGASWIGSVSNNIVSGMTSRGMTIGQPTQTSGSVGNDHNLVFNTVFNDFTPGPGTSFADPLFVGGTNYRLTDSSPARNTGNPVRVPGDLTTDLDGNPRQIDTVDMGAYESSTPTSPCFTDISAGLPGVYGGVLQGTTSVWGDYDNDDDLDILLSGFDGSASIARVYRSSGGTNPTFSDIGAGLLAGGFDVATAWGDYDRDGDLDLVVTRAGGSRVYRNSGGATPTFSDIGAGLPSADHGAVAWGDFDGDGDLDLLLTGWDGTARLARLYRNDGGPNPTFTHVTTVTLTAVTTGSLAWGDYDNDRDLDILLAGDDGTTPVTKLYRNSGGASASFTDIATGLPGVRRGSLAWGDYDSDGDLDILLTGNTLGLGNITRVYRNSGGATPTFSDIGATLQGVAQSSVAWGDYDNDGDLDILLTGLDGATRITRLYSSSGGSNPTFSLVTAGSIAVGGGSVAWGDCDNDSDLDLLLTGHDGSTGISRVYRNDCATLANTPPAAPANLSSNAGSVATFTWTAPADAQTPSSALHYNLRVGTTPGGTDLVSPMANGATGYRRVVALGNANQSTSWDVTLPGPGTYFWSVQAVDGAFAGSTFASEQTVTVPLCFEDIGAGLTGVHASSVAWGDYDNDGDLDALLGGTGSAETLLYRNSGGANPTFSDAGAGLGGTSAGSVAWGDYDNDGDLDILITGNNSARIYRNSGGPDPTFFGMSAGLPSVSKSAAAWGDFDNDNDLDILLSGQNASFMNLTRLYRNNGGSNPTFSEYGGGLGGFAVSSGAVAWGDYDNDNDIDFVLTGLDNSLTPVTRIYRNNGGSSPSFANMGNGNLTPVGMSAVAWGDCDNDGDLDLLLAGYTGSASITKVFRNNGGPNPMFTDLDAGLPSVVTSSTSGSVAWGNYDKDGRLDILLTGANVARVYRNKGGTTPTFSDIGAFLRPVESSSAAWGDYDNDGDLDILHTGFSAMTPSGPSSQVYRNLCGSVGKVAGMNGSFVATVLSANTPPGAPTDLYGRTDGTVARFSWYGATDAQTPSQAISYNLRVGTSPGASDIVSPMADMATGFRRVPSLLGNVGQNTTWEVILPGPGTYYWNVQAVDGGSTGSVFAVEEIPVDVDEDAPEIAGYGLSIRGANPFSSSTTIRFSQPTTGWVSLAVYDIAGRRVRTLVNGSLPAGHSTTAWDGKDESGRFAASGVYFLRMRTDAVVKTQKVSLVR